MVNALTVIALNIVGFCILGGALGFVLRSRLIFQLLADSLLSLAIYTVFQLRGGTLSLNWSLQDITAAVEYLVAPYVFLCLLPTVASSLLVARWMKASRS
jgi:hypothetical protein